MLAKSRDSDVQLEAWKGWHTIAPPMRKDYQRFVELANEGAKGLGFKDLGELWRAGYDMSPVEFEAETERLWTQVKPLYDGLHCYARGRLQEKYGKELRAGRQADPGPPASATCGRSSGTTSTTCSSPTPACRTSTSPPNSRSRNTTRCA